MSDFFGDIVEQDEDTLSGRFLTFIIDRDTFGVEIKHVLEIIGIQPITEVPELPAYAKGIINIRGKIVPVIDLRIKFKKEPVPYDERTCIIIVEIQDVTVGFIVDNIDEVIPIPPEDILPPPDYKTGFYNRYILGIGKVGDSVKLLVDCDKVLAEDELEEIKQINQ
ncbi:MAG: purine-binding chemotaxis protein CheW [Hyphomonadaceae bacterium]|nr:purine-binding chemotaxis protein CheW [Clostridia bacterium]